MYSMADHLALSIPEDRDSVPGTWFWMLYQLKYMGQGITRPIWNNHFWKLSDHCDGSDCEINEIELTYTDYKIIPEEWKQEWGYI